MPWRPPCKPAQTEPVALPEDVGLVHGDHLARAVPLLGQLEGVLGDPLRGAPALSS